MVSPTNMREPPLAAARPNAHDPVVQLPPARLVVILLAGLVLPSRCRLRLQEEMQSSKPTSPFHPRCAVACSVPLKPGLIGRSCSLPQPSQLGWLGGSQPWEKVLTYLPLRDRSAFAVGLQPTLDFDQVHFRAIQRLLPCLDRRGRWTLTGSMVLITLS